MIADKNCLCCGKSIRGRTDKKFCSDSCRSAHHNHLHGAQTHIRMVNHALRKNYHILETLLGVSKSTAKTTRKQLALNGFNFRYFTHCDVNRLGQKICCCYNIGYRAIKDLVVVVRRNTT